MFQALNIVKLVSQKTILLVGKSTECFHSYNWMSLSVWSPSDEAMIVVFTYSCDECEQTKNRGNLVKWMMVRLWNFGAHMQWHLVYEFFHVIYAIAYQKSRYWAYSTKIEFRHYYLSFNSRLCLKLACINIIVCESTTLAIINSRTSLKFRINTTGIYSNSIRTKSSFIGDTTLHLWVWHLIKLWFL